MANWINHRSGFLIEMQGYALLDFILFIDNNLLWGFFQRTGVYTSIEDYVYMCIKELPESIKRGLFVYIKCLMIFVTYISISLILYTR